MTFNVTRVSPPMTVNTARLVATLQAEAVSRIIRRTARGVDANDRAFAPYSASYIRKLVAGGEDVRVDLRLTGGLLNSVKVVRTERRGNATIIVIAPDTGTSHAVTLTGGRAARSREGARALPHNVVGAYLHRGIKPHLPPRPWLRLSPRDIAGMRTALYRASTLRGGG